MSWILAVVFQTFAVFIAYPLAAFIPAAAFAGFYAMRRRKGILVAALCWAGYAIFARRHGRRQSLLETTNRVRRQWMLQTTYREARVIDGVANDFRDLDGFARECAEAAAMGFDGKSLIHPAQIEPANRAFSPSAEALAEARAIRDAFARPENAGKGVIALDGKMVERLHLAQAEKLLAKAAIIGA